MTKRLHSAVWFTTMACNFKCHYCWEVQAQEHGLYKAAPFGETCDKWVAAWNKLKPSILDITGGEPFLLPWLTDMIKRLDPDIKLGMTTNISHDLTHFVQEIGPERFVNITCSFHPTENGTARNPMNLYLFTGRALMLKNRGFPITINFVTWPEQLWLIDDFKAWFEQKGLRFHVDSYSSISYYPFKFSDKELAYAGKFLAPGRKPPELVQKYGQNYQVTCSGGLSHLSVQPNGDATRCILEHQLLHDPAYPKDNVKAVGNILDPDFELWDTELPCNEHFRCPGCDRDKVKFKFVQEIDRTALGLPPITV